MSVSSYSDNFTLRGLTARRPDNGARNLVVRVNAAALGDKPLFALNNDEDAFVTGSQPFLTEQGIVTIDQILGFTPAAGNDDRNLLLGRERHTPARITRLDEHDPYSVRQVDEKLQSIRARNQRPGTQIYHLHVDGDGTYVVNKYRIVGK